MGHFRLLLVVSVFAVAQWSMAAPLWQEGAPRPKTEKTTRTSAPDFSHLAPRATTAVVAISTVEQREPGEDPIRDLLEPKKSDPQKGLGSGFFVNSEGYLVTNAHVVEGATKITIIARINDHNCEYPVRIIGFDKATDVALLKVDPDGNERFPSLPLGNSDELQVAEWVAAIGNPYGLAHSVTVGVVSYIGRTDVAPAGRDGYYDYIQTDASINPGNSGGPLLNSRGEVVGIANAINAVGQGIGFAVPINMAKKVLPALLKEGRVHRSWLGLTVEDLTPAATREHELPKNLTGVLVSEVVVGAPGDRAGIKAGDVIVQFDGTPIDDAQKLRWLAAVTESGKQVPVTIERKGHAERVTVTLAPLPEAEPASSIPQPAAVGLLVREVDMPTARAEGLALPGGAYVKEVKPDSPAHQAGLQKGDVILKVDDLLIHAPAALSRAMAKVESGRLVRMVVRRHGQTMFLTLKKP